MWRVQPSSKSVQFKLHPTPPFTTAQLLFSARQNWSAAATSADSCRDVGLESGGLQGVCRAVQFLTPPHLFAAVQQATLDQLIHTNTKQLHRQVTKQQ
jgi:hypothetical protein